MQDELIKELMQFRETLDENEAVLIGAAILRIVLLQKEIEGLKPNQPINNKTKREGI